MSKGFAKKEAQMWFQVSHAKKWFVVNGDCGRLSEPPLHCYR